MEQAKKARTNSKRKFTKAENSLQEILNVENPTIATVNKRYEALRDAWVDAQEKNEAYEELSQVEEDWIEEMRQRFQKGELQADRMVAELRVEEREAETLRRREGERLESDNRVKEQVRGLNVKCTQEKGKFGIIATQLSECLEDKCGPASEETLADLLSNLRTRMGACELVQEQYISEIGKLGESLDKGKDTKWMADIIKEYHDLNKRSKEHISVWQREREDRLHKGIRLEKLKFSTFDGNPRNYAKFKEDFNKYIKPRYTAQEECFALRSYLQPVVKEEVNHLRDNIDDIWERLDIKFGDESKLIDLIMNDIRRLPAGRENSTAQTLKMIETVEKAHSELVSMGRESEINNSTIVALLEEKLPRDIKREWIELVTGEKRREISNQKFTFLLQLLLKFKARIEYEFSAMRNLERNSASSNYVENSVNAVGGRGFHRF